MNNSNLTVSPQLIKMLLLLGLVILYGFSFNFFLSQFTTVSQKITQERQNILTLQQKSATLADSSTSIVTFTDSILNALPQTDASLLGIGQIKSIASTSSMIVDNISYSSSNLGNSDLNKILFSVDLDGDVNSLRIFLDTIEKSSPVSTIENLRVLNETSNNKVSLSIAYYWSLLPARLPELESAIKTLSKEDMDLLISLSSLTSSQNTGSSSGSGVGDQDLTVPERQNIFENAN